MLQTMGKFCLTLLRKIISQYHVESSGSEQNVHFTLVIIALWEVRDVTDTQLLRRSLFLA